MNREIWETYGGRIVGLSIGFILGILYLIVGLWDTIVVSVIICLGYYVGKKMDANQSIQLPFDRVLEWLLQKWRPYK